MLIDHRERPTLAEGEPDPATPERRAELARSLLESAVRRYDQSSAAWSAIHESYPTLPEPLAPDDAEREERRAWLRLLREADDDFDLAEMNLASRINGLYDLIAPEGRRARDMEGEYFVPRAVRLGGRVFVLVDSIDRYEPRTNFVAVYHESMVVALDAGAIVDEK